MTEENFINLIQEKNYNKEQFVEIVLNDEFYRKIAVDNMTGHNHIMVYYHCYEVLKEATKISPAKFEQYKDEFIKLLEHRNSYHRDFALEIIGNLTKVDEEDRFSEIKDDFFSIVNDEKFMTGNCCVRNLLKIYQHKAELRDQIIELLLDIDKHCDYTEKQKGVLKADILDIFDEVYRDVTDRDKINEFMKAEVNSISPKTRKKAKELVKKYGL